MSEKVFLNDKLINADAAAISVSDSGFLYGAGLFETISAYNGHVFRLDDHLDRLYHSAKAFIIALPERQYIKNAINSVLQANELPNARIRITVTNGPISAEQLTPTLLITAAKAQPYPEEYYKNGILAVICPFKQNPFDPSFGHKTLSYYPRIMALNLARAKSAVEAIWFTVDNRLAEGCVSSIFIVEDSKLYTPPTTTPVLPGIARKTVIELAKQNDIEVIEKDLFINDLLEADEVFFTNVIMKVLPATKIEKKDIADAKVGPVTRQLGEKFDRFIEKTTREEK